MARSTKPNSAPARINITLNAESPESMKTRELPMKLLFLGEFDQAEGQLPLRERSRFRVDGSRLDPSIRKLSPTVTLSVPAPFLGPDASESVALSFQSLGDFHPDTVAKRVPVLRQWLVMRTLLKDLKACVMDKPSFRRALNEIMHDPDKLKHLSTQLQQLAPLTSHEDTQNVKCV